ncbi:hypothetical protein [Mucilaginibacter ginsenosidivorans]|uniref:CcmD family protein n=1 Tax=Mucilaginibacter ginsenosidivorans TaxID=398053 RepID=A0A5B8UU71_9SPHI|nr:hypothetical protein [Mucilaginibacter ginsenosidivorans]QEC62305.1 hypothetical protein FRZ54_06815 [Mucilaginibacter ginsenosidivorans]
MMKTKTFTIFTTAYLLFTTLNSAYAMTKDSTIAQESHPDGLGETFFVLIILILLLLALWILKNSYRLKENIESKELDSKDWLNNHIKDMEPDQLTTLINRGHAKQQQK